jgi:hypothetical protein
MSFDRPRAALALVLAVGFLAACSPSPPKDDVHRYTVRGEVSALPRPGQPGSELLIHHETVPDFVDSSGKTVEMQSMTMPFSLADGVSLVGISRGDKVELTFEVRWHGAPPLQLTAIHKLPPDTELDFH